MTNPRPLLIKAGRVVDPSRSMDERGDLLLRDGVVAAIQPDITPPDGARVIDAAGLVVCPGFIDLHCHLREPGFEYKETIATGTRAAARGGFTTLCAMPNTDPVMDSRAVVDFVLRRAREEGAVRVLPIGAVTAGSRGTALTEMAELADAGAVGFSDDGHPVADANVMRHALSYASGLGPRMGVRGGLPIINHCDVPELSAGGVMNEGWVATRLGLKGLPRSAEEAMVARDIALAETTGGRLHVAHASTAGTVDLVRQARARGLDVTCEATPHHLTLTDEAVLGLGAAAYGPLSTAAYDANARVAPPLRSRDDVAAMVEGLRDGAVDFIATDHAPHAHTEKMCTFEEAANGISVLETALGSLMSLVHGGDLSLPTLIDRLTAAPARFLGMDLGTLRPGAPADVTVFDPGAEWLVDPAAFASKGKNTPLAGATLKGRVTATIASGEVVYHDGATD